jgi:hypothetical protein
MAAARPSFVDLQTLANLTCSVPEDCPPLFDCFLLGPDDKVFTCGCEPFSGLVRDPQDDGCKVSHPARMPYVILLVLGLVLSIMVSFYTCRSVYQMKKVGALAANASGVSIVASAVAVVFCAIAEVSYLMMPLGQDPESFYFDVLRPGAYLFWVASFPVAIMSIPLQWLELAILSETGAGKAEVKAKFAGARSKIKMLVYFNPLVLVFGLFTNYWNAVAFFYGVEIFITSVGFHMSKDKLAVMLDPHCHLEEPPAGAKPVAESSVIAAAGILKFGNASEKALILCVIGLLSQVGLNSNYTTYMSAAFCWQFFVFGTIIVAYLNTWYIRRGANKKMADAGYAQKLTNKSTARNTTLFSMRSSATSSRRGSAASIAPMAQSTGGGTASSASE